MWTNRIATRFLSFSVGGGKLVRDISINYGRLEATAQELLIFRDALEEMLAAMKEIGSSLEQNEGKTITQLLEDHKELEKAVEAQIEEIDDLYTIFSGYYNEMSALVAAEWPADNTRVDRDDVIGNIHSMENSVQDLRTEIKRRLRDEFSLPALSEEERDNQKYNLHEIEDLEDDIMRKIDSMDELIDQLQQLHQYKLIPFENMDDEYQNKARELYDAYSTRSERWEARAENIGDAVTKTVKGVQSGLEEFGRTAAGLVKTQAATGIVNLLPESLEPDWAAKCVEQKRAGMRAVVADPWLIAEGFAQGFSDTYEEEGIAFVAGTLVPEVAATWLTKGGSQAVKAGTKVDDVLDAQVKVPEMKTAGSSAPSYLGVKDLNDFLSRIPEGATEKPWIEVPGGAKEGVKYTWTDGEGNVWNVRAHSSDPSAPVGSNASEGWIYRVEVRYEGKGKTYYMDSEGNFHPQNVMNPNSPMYNESIANDTHIPFEE